MDDKILASTAKLGIFAALSAASLLALSACDERPYPSSHTAPPPAPATAELMGAPEQTSPYTAPPVVQAPAYAPTPYDSGSVVAMAPIPNPGDPGSGPYYDVRRQDHRIHAHYDAGGAMVAENTVTSPYGEGHPAAGHHPAYTYPATAGPDAPAASTSASAPAAPGSGAAAVADGGKTVTHGAGVAVSAAGAALGAAALQANHAAHAAVQAVQPKASAPAQLGTAPAPSGDEATNLATLQTTLTDAVGKTAILATPAQFAPNQPADVTLTLPADFADTLHGAAQKDGLGDAAASANLTALLSGDGYVATPNDTQSVLITAGQPTQFHWTVTAQPNAKGPLHADVGVDLLGGGSQKLALGSVQPKGAESGIKTPQVVGIALLALMAALVAAWLARGRSPTRSAAARRASRLATRDSSRPFDMTGSLDD